MIKSFLPALLSLCLATSAFAQLGIKGGVAISTLREQREAITREDFENKSVITPVIGLSYDLNIADIITIQPELLYSQSGGRNTYSIAGTTYENTYRINYLELPVLFKLQIGNEDNEAGKTGFYIAAGPWVGYALNGKYKNQLPVLGTLEGDFSFDDKDDAKRLNTGLVAAAGVNFGKVVLDLRYNFGLNNLIDA
ncbi:MAG TPA: porin family protein, partial [Saprospiraceae bacterium]|nr:porin family protein [Saprospiraceae bacterium]